MYLHKTPFLLKKLYPSLIWNKERNAKKLYITFDDGPIREVTEYVLEELEKFKALATFFCVGENIKKHQDVFQKVISKGHAIGNHTYNHLNGFKTLTPFYLENIKAACDIITENSSGSASRLFRPPYGRITRKQIQALTPTYDIIMWDVLTGDFDKNLSPEKCLKAVLRYSKPGSILVFHDSVKTYSTVKFVLPRVLNHFMNLGYEFEKL